MSTKTTANNAAAQTDAVDALLALTNIYFSSAERLSELALANARKTVEDCVSVTADASATRKGRESDALQSVFGQPAIERAMTYSRSAFEILTQAQQEAMQVLGKQFSMPQMQFPLSGDWRAGFDLFTRNFRDLSSMTAANVSAAADAGSKLVADAERAAKKVA